MRKPRKPKPIILDTMKWVMDGVRPTAESYLDRLRIPELAAIDAFARGKARIQEWHDVCNILNLCETMARMGIGPEALAACESAQTALMDAQQRFERTGRMGITGPGLQALRDLYEYHDLQRQSVSRAEYEKAIVTTMQRVTSKAPEVVEL